ncbi:MAG: class I adenylate-forming enzyme family protein [Armatimonadota bacterium]
MNIGLSHIAAFWDNTVAKLPRSVAMVFEGRPWTYAEADALVARVAGWLAEVGGVGKGDRVLLALPNCPEFVIAYWATLRLGAVVAPVNTRLRADELQYVVQNCDAKVVVVHAQTEEAVRGALAAAGLGPKVLRVEPESGGVAETVCSLTCATGPADCTTVKSAGPVAHTATPPDSYAFGHAASHHRTHATTDIEADDLAVILHTSGTTGVPKGAMMRHCDLLFNVMNAILAHSFRHEDLHLLAIPCFAPTCSYSLLATCAYLGSGVVIAPRPQPAELLELVCANQCTTFIGVPTMFHMLTLDAKLAEVDLSFLRLIAYSGAPMPARTIRLLRERFPHVALHNFFGLTETISITHVLPSKDAATRADSIGKLLPEVYAKIVDDQGQELAAGEIGELCLRRDNIIPGYWNRPGLLEEAIKDGWFHTGDYAKVDEEGYFYVQGRKKEMIIVAGQNVYAHEVEKVILGHDGVREAAVVGVPATGVRAALGELVKAVVVCQPETDLRDLDIKRHCAAALPSYKVPQIVEFREELPKNATGKVLKREL